MPHRTQVYRVAMACQGGGSHAAFTAGVLQRILMDDAVEVRALSGTSGGAVSAVCAWSGLVGRGPDVSHEAAIGRLQKVWVSNMTPWWMRGAEAASLLAMRAGGEVGFSPEFSAYVTPLDPRRNFTDLLEGVVPFDEVGPDVLSDDDPRLLVSATDVLTGEFRVFRSHRLHGYEADRITSDVILASAALPTVFRAVHLGGGTYWDGGFSQNPPIRELIAAARRDVPDEWPVDDLDAADHPGHLPSDRPGTDPTPEPIELWIVQINPEARAREPRSMDDIRDRRNELAANISFQQEVHTVGLVNDLVRRRLLAPRALRRYGLVKVRVIAMDPAFAEPLDYESKLERDPAFISGLLEHGQTMAGRFLEAVHAHDDDATALPGRDIWGRWTRRHAPNS